MSGFGSGYEGWGELTDIPGKYDSAPEKDERFEEYGYYPAWGKMDTQIRRRRIITHKPDTEHFVADCPPGDVQYVYGLWDRQAKSPDGCPLSVRNPETEKDYRRARRFAKWRSRSTGTCDFVRGTEGHSIVLIEYRNASLKRIWEFDRRGRERMILDHT